MRRFGKIMRMKAINDNFYINLNQRLLSRPRLVRLLAAANRGITAVVFAAYPLLLLYLFVTGGMAVRYIAIPAASFAGVSVSRVILHSRRPYEMLPVTPLIPKETKGKSFPSRHVFSAFMIAMTYLAAAYYSGGPLLRSPLFAAAVLLFVLSDVLGDLRVLLGVHFLRDTIAGMLIAIVCGLGFFLPN